MKVALVLRNTEETQREDKTKITDQLNNILNLRMSYSLIERNIVTVLLVSR